MTNCKFRKTQRECKAPDTVSSAYCERCLKGQIADEIALNTSALMTASMDKLEEKACKSQTLADKLE